MKREGKCNMGGMKLVVLYLALVLVLAAFLPGCFVVGDQELKWRKQAKSNSSPFPTLVGTSAVYPVLGNVYPVGYYYVDIRIGYPPKPFYLDIDTGSDLTWLHCDAPCLQCPEVPHPLYRLIENSHILCPDPICAIVHALEDHQCEKPTDHCDYEVEYADQGSSQGLLVKDVFPLRSSNGSLVGPRLFFGCGFDQEGSSGTTSPTDGVLGLGRGKSSIVSQLQRIGLVRNVIGHCFSSNGGGFLFFGDDLVPSSGVVWTPMSRDPKNQNHYSPGPAELFFGKQSISVKDLHVVFDSGSSYTYFNSQAYNALISSIMKDLTKTPLKITASDETLSICWKGAKAFKSITEVKKYFKPVILSFMNGKKAQRMEIPPESYLIISEFGNVCSGILNGTEIGLEDLNLIGDNFFQDRTVIYDNEKQEIGWATANCDRLPNIDREEDLSQLDTAGLDILTEDYGPGVSGFQKEYEESHKKDELRK
ncbi:aspartic proteinase Asp1-like [Papaver somniferum]|uniref:aspartic proteinase Asp1-like n=1 Tax=Papaver somniferum TaxID=3469 RepID=UPI000E7056C1|nr:aspartic proteinase Asp1-like [Papaver somniferum]